MSKKIKVGLFGFGTVGQGVYQIVQNSKLPFEISSICVRDRSKSRNLGTSIFTFSPDDILQNPEIDLVVEAISESEPAFDIVKKALEEGKAVVTANKKMVAEHLAELLALQKSVDNYRFRYEAAVAGAIPIIQALDQYFGHEPVSELRGILNGSSNYILSKMYREKTSYADALQQAQDKGFAEIDPTLDVSGMDACNKLCILALHAFGVVIHPSEVDVKGIDNIKSEDIALAKAENKKIKPIASLKLDSNNQLSAKIGPELLDKEDPLYTIDEEFNAVLVNGLYGGTQHLSGKGAGSLPTGTAVVSDMLALYQERYYLLQKLKEAKAPLTNSLVYL